MDSSHKHNVITSQNSIAYESDSEVIAAVPTSTAKSGKFNFTCKLCGSIIRSESSSSVSSDFTAESLKTSVCFKLCQKRLKLKGKSFLQKTALKATNEKLPHKLPSVPYDMCNETSNSILNYRNAMTSNYRNRSKKPLTCLSKLQKKIKKKKEAPLKPKITAKSNLKAGKGVYISNDSDSSISGSSLVCIKDENDSSNNSVEVDETREVEEGINNLMREHFEAKSAAEHQSKSQRHIIFRKIFSPKENEKPVFCKDEDEKVELEPLNRSKIHDSAQHGVGDEDDSEEVRDKPTSLSAFPYNRERKIQKNRTSTQQPLLKDGCESNEVSGRTERKGIRRANSDARHERRIQKRNNNIGVCNECKLRMIGSPLDNKTPSESESSRNATLSTDLSTPNHTTPIRSQSFRHAGRAPMLHSLSVSRCSSGRRNNDVSLHPFTKRSYVNHNLSQANSSQRTSNFMSRSLSANSSSPSAFRRTHSVRYPANNQEAKTYSRRRTTTIGSCNFPGDGNDVISTVRTHNIKN